MTITMNSDTNTTNVNINDVSELINGIDNGICTVACVTSTTSVDATGDYRITRRLECVWANKEIAGSDSILDLEISGTQGTTPVVTLNGQVLPTASLILAANGVLEIRNLKGMLIDRVQLPNKATASVAGAGYQGLPYQTPAPVFGNINNSLPYGYVASGTATPYAVNAPVPFATSPLGLVKKPFLGIAVRPVSGELIHHIAVDARNVCVVSDVIPGSPAFAAGLEPSDIILGINGKQASLANLRHELDAAKIGQILRLAVLGKGVKREIDVLLDGNFAINGAQVLPTQAPTSAYVDFASAPISSFVPFNKSFNTGLPMMGTGLNFVPECGLNGSFCTPNMGASTVLGTTAFASPRSGSVL